MNIDEVLKAVVERAKELRAAGVNRLKVGDVVIDLAPVPERIPATGTEPPAFDLPVEEDGATYGMGGRVPGYRRRR